MAELEIIANLSYIFIIPYPVTFFLHFIFKARRQIGRKKEKARSEKCVHEKCRACFFEAAVFFHVSAVALYIQAIYHSHKWNVFKLAFSLWVYRINIKYHTLFRCLFFCWKIQRMLQCSFTSGNLSRQKFSMHQ